jgi:hypothetical protein
MKTKVIALFLMTGLIATSFAFTLKDQTKRIRLPQVLQQYQPERNYGIRIANPATVQKAWVMAIKQPS